MRALLFVVSLLVVSIAGFNSAPAASALLGAIPAPWGCGEEKVLVLGSPHASFLKGNPYDSADEAVDLFVATVQVESSFRSSVPGCTECSDPMECKPFANLVYGSWGTSSHDGGTLVEFYTGIVTYGCTDCPTQGGGGE